MPRASTLLPLVVRLNLKTVGANADTRVFCAQQVYRATVNATGQQIAVKKVDLEALGANLVRSFDIGVFVSCIIKREMEDSALHSLGCDKYRPVM